MDSRPAARLATLARTLGGPHIHTHTTLTIIIVGGAVLDVTAAPSSRPSPGGSVPGAVTVTPGGVGLNMASGLARLLPASRVLLVSAVVNDAAGAFLCASARAARVDTTHLATLPPSPSAPRTAVVATLLDADGDVAASVADVAVLEHGVSETDVATAMRAALASADTLPPLVIVDGNLPPASLAAVAAVTRVTLFEPVSAVKAARAVGAASTHSLPSQPPFTCALATPNLAELGAMARATGWTGAEPRAGAGVASVARAAGPAARAVLASRVAVALLVTAGPAGAVLVGPREVVAATPLLPALLAAAAASTAPPLTNLVAVAIPAAPVPTIVSTGGAGDAAAAGALAALARGSGAATTVAAACAAAAQALADRAAAPPLDAARVAEVVAQVERQAVWIDL